MSDKVALTFTVNGQRHQVSVPPMKRLLDVLREDCALTGTKEGCGEGERGACTVLLDGVTVNSCLVPAVHADGKKLETVEGLARGRGLSLLQEAFVTMGGAQCGICTPGILISAHELIRRSAGRVPSADEVREALAGNLCRCTGYQKIVDAVRAAAAAERRAGRASATTRRATKPKRAAKPKRAVRAAKARPGTRARRARSRA